MIKRIGRNFTPEFIQYLKDEFPHKSTYQIADECGEKYGTISNIAYRLHLRKSDEYHKAYMEKTIENLKHGAGNRFQKGHTSWLKGKKGVRQSPHSEFKKGNTPHNTLPIGAQREATDGYVYRKVSETKPRWKSLQQIVWEEHNGPVPKNHMVLFKDKNARNFDISNLECISRSENMKRNSLLRYPNEIVQAIKTISKLKKQIKNHGEKQN